MLRHGRKQRSLTAFVFCGPQTYSLSNTAGGGGKAMFASRGQLVGAKGGVPVQTYPFFPQVLAKM